jgi:hypothetical protein
MISWLLSKIDIYRRRRAEHEASWSGFDIQRADGTTGFQAQLIDALRQEPGVAHVELVKGDKENFYKGSLATANVEFYIYEDEAQLAKVVYERWAYDSRKQLVDDFLQNARKAQHP